MSIGSYRDSTLSALMTRGPARSRRSSNNATRPVGTAVGPRSCHTPETSESAPESTAPSTMLRRNNGLPPDESQMTSALRPSSDPPRTISTSDAHCSLVRFSSSRRCRYPSFHSDVTASGTDSPVRTVAMMRALRSIAIWCSSVAES